jgi:hypothetical protein
VFITDENNAFAEKWPSLVAKFGKMKKSNFYRIDSSGPGMKFKKGLKENLYFLRSEIKSGYSFSC